VTATNTGSSAEKAAFREAMQVLLEFDDRDTALEKLVHLSMDGKVSLF